jgi:hypothetical protein
MFGFFWVLAGINEGVFPPYPQKNLREGTKRGPRGRWVRGRGSRKKRQKIGQRGLDLTPLLA